MVISHCSKFSNSH